VKTKLIPIDNSKVPRAGWAEAAQKLRERQEDALPEMPMIRFDTEEWDWR
jgi:hypothetical protein